MATDNNFTTGGMSEPRQMARAMNQEPDVSGVDPAYGTRGANATQEDFPRPNPEQMSKIPDQTPAPIGEQVRHDAPGMNTMSALDIKKQNADSAAAYAYPPAMTGPHEPMHQLPGATPAPIEPTPDQKHHHHRHHHAVGAGHHGAPPEDKPEYGGADTTPITSSGYKLHP